MAQYLRWLVEEQQMFGVRPTLAWSFSCSQLLFFEGFVGCNEAEVALTHLCCLLRVAPAA